jgi:hypothetical protein
VWWGSAPSVILDSAWRGPLRISILRGGCQSRHLHRFQNRCLVLRAWRWRAVLVRVAVRLTLGTCFRVGYHLELTTGVAVFETPLDPPDSRVKLSGLVEPTCLATGTTEDAHLCINQPRNSSVQGVGDSPYRV